MAALSPISRRAFVKGIPAAHLALTAASAVPHDPILDAIDAYRAAVAAYNVTFADDDKLSEEEYERQPHIATYRALENWQKPAVSSEGAYAALRFAIEDIELFEDMALALPMIGAAMQFLYPELTP